MAIRRLITLTALSVPLSWEALYQNNYRQCSEKKTPFEKAIWAIKRGHLQYLSRLIDEGNVSLNVGPYTDTVPLQIAASRGDAYVLRHPLSQVHCFNRLAPSLSSF